MRTDQSAEILSLRDFWHFAARGKLRWKKPVATGDRGHWPKTIKTLSLAFGVLGMLGTAFAQPFQYDITLDRYTNQEGGIAVDALIRVQGEPYTRIKILSRSRSGIQKLFEEKFRTGDMEYSYFRIQTKIEIPKACSMPISPHLDIVTKEVLADLALNQEFKRASTTNAERDGHLNLFSLGDTDIIKIQEISQNEFLNVKPRILEVPTR